MFHLILVQANNLTMIMIPCQNHIKEIRKGLKLVNLAEETNIRIPAPMMQEAASNQ